MEGAHLLVQAGVLVQLGPLRRPPADGLLNAHVLFDDRELLQLLVRLEPLELARSVFLPQAVAFLAHLALVPQRFLHLPHPALDALRFEAKAFQSFLGAVAAQLPGAFARKDILLVRLLDAGDVLFFLALRSPVAALRFLHLLLQSHHALVLLGLETLTHALAHVVGPLRETPRHVDLSVDLVAVPLEPRVQFTLQLLQPGRVCLTLNSA